MANPRKFSEKIALLNQKQAEETARFEAIMREVSDVTSRQSNYYTTCDIEEYVRNRPFELLYHTRTRETTSLRGRPGYLEHCRFARDASMSRNVNRGAAASASSSVGASPTGASSSTGDVPPAGRPLSVKSAGASPPQSSGKHLHISLAQQYRAGGSLPNVNKPQESNSLGVGTSVAIHSIDLKELARELQMPRCVLHASSRARYPRQPTAREPTKSAERCRLRSSERCAARISACSSERLAKRRERGTALSNLEEMQQNQGGYRNQQQQQQPQQIQVAQVQAQQQNQQQPERGRSMGVGPMRKPVERRHDTSPYSGVPYLSPPLPENWRRTISDSALHQSANEACLQNTTGIQHRRESSNRQPHDSVADELGSSQAKAIFNAGTQLVKRPIIYKMAMIKKLWMHRCIPCAQLTLEINKQYMFPCARMASMVVNCFLK
ncbi:unnamed protein product, partial [Trichogramma brassicae]